MRENKRIPFGSAAIYVIGHLTIANCTISHNNVTAISLIRSQVTFSGNITIKNNTGISGGGMILCETSSFFFSPNTIISFTNNHARHSGGAIYAAEQCGYSNPTCFFRINTAPLCKYCKRLEQIAKCNNNSILMENNTAAYAGNHIYGGTVSSCHFRETLKAITPKVFYSIFKVSENGPKDYSAVSSDPVKVCFCSPFNYPNCSLRHYSHGKEIYPGQTINISVVVVGQLDGTVPGTVIINGSNPFHISNIHCTNLTIAVNSKITDTDKAVKVFRLEVLNSITSTTESMDMMEEFFSVGYPRYIQVPVKPCPLGFELGMEGICICDVRLSNNGIDNCNISLQTIHRTHPKWIGYNNIASKHFSKGVLFHKVCPFDYCIETDVNIPVTDKTLNSDEQCSSNRTGLLCGACMEGFSIAFGTSKCIDCTGKFKLFGLVLVLLSVLAGVILVLMLMACDITTTDGTLSGLLFYANILYSNAFIFGLDDTGALSVIIHWLNLSYGIPTCFYNGMSTYVKSWLEYLFPLYLWLLILIIIWLSNHSRKIANIFGQNAVKVLATLLEISYYKIIQANIMALSFTIVEYPLHTKAVHRYVWLYDANVDYLQGKHIPLFIMGLLFSVLVLAYTILLLSVQPLQRYSHLYCFRWVARLKPLIDAYTAPHVIKDSCRYWVGLLMFFRIILSIYFAINIKNQPESNFTAIILACLFIFTTAWYVEGVYKTKFLKLLNSSYLVNLTILAASTNLLLSNDKESESRIMKHHGHKSILVNVSVGVAVITTFGVLFFNIYKRIFKYINCKKSQQQTPLLDVSENSILHSHPVNNWN